MLQRENNKFIKQINKFGFVVSLLLIIIVIVLILYKDNIDIFSIAHNNRTHSRWLYIGDIDIGPEKYFKVKFVNDNDWNYIMKIPIGDKLLIINPYVIYCNRQITLDSKVNDEHYFTIGTNFYPEYYFRTIRCFESKQKVSLAINQYDEAIILNKHNNIKEYCRIINSLKSNNISFAEQSDKTKIDFYLTHIYNFYNNCYIYDIQNLENIDQNKSLNDNIIQIYQFPLKKLFSFEFDEIKGTLKEEKNPNDDIVDEFKCLVMHVTNNGKIAPIIVKIQVNKTGEISIYERKFPIRNWLYEN